MEDLWKKKIKLLTQMPPVYCNIGSPKFAGYFKVELNTWSIDENDYVQVEKGLRGCGNYEGVEDPIKFKETWG